MLFFETIQNGTNHIDMTVYLTRNRFFGKIINKFIFNKYLFHWAIQDTPLHPMLKDAMNEKLSRINVNFYISGFPSHWYI